MDRYSYPESTVAIVLAPFRCEILKQRIICWAIAQLLAIVWVTISVAPLHSQTHSTYEHLPCVPTHSNPLGPCAQLPRVPAESGLWKLPGYGGQPARVSTKRTRLIESSLCSGSANYFSWNWEAPFKVKRTNYGYGCPYLNSTMQPSPLDSLNRFAMLKLLPNVRQDNGYCGPGCDGYGYYSGDQSAFNFPSTAPRYYRSVPTIDR